MFIWVDPKDTLEAAGKAFYRSSLMLQMKNFIRFILSIPAYVQLRWGWISLDASFVGYLATIYISMLLHVYAKKEDQLLGNLVEKR